MEHRGGCEKEGRCEACEVRRLVENLTSAVAGIARGGVEAPGGLEALTMALAGGPDDSLADAVRDAGGEIAEAIHDLAGAVREARRPLSAVSVN